MRSAARTPRQAKRLAMLWSNRVRTLPRRSDKKRAAALALRYIRESLGAPPRDSADLWRPTP